MLHDEVGHGNGLRLGERASTGERVVTRPSTATSVPSTLALGCSSNRHKLDSVAQLSLMAACTLCDQGRLSQSADGDKCPGGLFPRGSFARGHFWPGDFWPRGFLSGGAFDRGGSFVWGSFARGGTFVRGAYRLCPFPPSSIRIRTV